MSNLFVLKFADEASAGQVAETMKRLQKQQLITVEDAAIVTRQQNGNPKVKQMHDLVGAGALGGAFWGLLIGLLFFVPIFGMAVGAASGALAGKFSDIGIDDNFIKQVGSSIQPGESALFLLTRNAVADKVLPELKQYKFEMIQTSLSHQDEAKLREMLGTTA
ncbi:MAG: DUF1269 domain-containing protein [Chloroflexi bacterium]|nr:DUF1269 domain-containing protein [Chloroflexota bacterium]